MMIYNLKNNEEIWYWMVEDDISYKERKIYVII